MNNNWKERGFRDTSHTAVIEEDDQRRLNQFFRHELALYNTLIEAFESRTRAFPGQVSSITERDIDLFATLAESNRQIADLAGDAELPKRLCALRESVKDSKGQLTVASHWQFIINTVLKERLAVLPSTKRLMIETMCRFYREQADILKDPQNSNVAEISYRAATSNLLKLDINGKRHAQVCKSDIKTKYNNELDQTEITVPLCLKPVLVPGINLNERQGWNMMILRQEPGRYVDNKTPWLVEFRNSNSYLLKLSDFGSRKNNRYNNSYVTSKAFG